ncbi:RNA splicing factor [Lithospermum erythrorhizon]|uniref:RNA splicing factor n=1 Tax=Lithospermum erythrorhizon TaxID=34254 RepID=A0AAV3NXX2_LITER
MDDKAKRVRDLLSSFYAPPSDHAPPPRPPSAAASSRFTTTFDPDRKYLDAGDPREMGMKRQRLMEGSSYYATPSASTYMYNPLAPTPPPPAAYSSYVPPPAFPVVRLRGLPFDCTETDITDFFHGLDVVDVLLVHKGGRFSGECYCVLGYPLQVDFALKRNKQNIGRRYVEVFRSKRQEYYKAIAHEASDSRGGSPRRPAPRARSFDDDAEHTGVLRMRGLPFSATKEDIVDFFKDFVLAEEKIHITTDSIGRPTGEAYVEFANAEDSKAAMANDRMTLGSRYIELFPSAPDELTEAVSKGRVKSVDGEDVVEPTTVIRMRGLPFSARKKDVIEFFKDFTLPDDSVYLTFNSEGRPTGEAFVEFSSADDAKAALTKDRMTLGSRYIELFASTLDELNDALARGR